MNTNLLRKVSLFSSLDTDALEALAANLQRVECAANHTVFWMDEKGEQLYIIESGKVRISYNDETGKEVVLAVLSPGSFFGELSLLDGGNHTATARTTQPTTLLVLDKDSFYRFLTKHPELAGVLLHTLTQRLRSSTVKMRGIANVNQQVDAETSPFQQFIDKLAKIFTSGTFLTCCVLFIVLWMGVQVYEFERYRPRPISFADRPPTFFLLGFIITLTSFLLTILILNSQRRQAENDRIRGNVEYQVNVKSQTEVMKLHIKVDRLLAAVERLTGKELDQPTEDTIT